MTVTVQARDADAFFYLVHVLAQEDVSVAPLGGNQFELADDVELSESALVELDKYAIGHRVAAESPVLDGEGSGPAPSVGTQPLAPAALAPLPKPPEHGPGSSTQAWRRYALQQDPPVEVTSDMGRDDIIRAVREAEGQS